MIKKLLYRFLISFFIALLSSGCITKLPTFSKPYPETINKWDSNAYYEWLKG